MQVREGQPRQTNISSRGGIKQKRLMLLTNADTLVSRMPYLKTVITQLYTFEWSV